METFPERLKFLINQKKLSNAEFANRLEIQKSTVSHLLSGRNKPGFDFLNKLIKVFPDINLRWLITGEGEPFAGITPTLVEIPAKMNESNKQEVEEIADSETKDGLKEIIVVYNDKTFDILKRRQ